MVSSPEPDPSHCLPSLLLLRLAGGTLGSRSTGASLPFVRPLIVKSRHVFHIAGYDPADADAYHRRFQRQLGVFRNTWGVEATASDLQLSGDLLCASIRVATAGPNWQVNAVHDLLRWDDLVRTDNRRGVVVRLLKALRAYLYFFLTGAVIRYAIANQRYAAFFLYPLMQLAMFAALAAAAGYGAFRASHDIGPLAFAAAALAALAVFALLLRWPGGRWRLQHVLDDWIFTWEILHGSRPDVSERLDRFAALIAERTAASPADEVVVVGHSLGASFAIEVLTRLRASDPDFARNHRVSLLTVGATTPKFTLDPRGAWLRQMIRSLVDDPSMNWVEWQTRDDPISFYKFHPVSLKRIRKGRLDGRPLIRRVQIHDMLKPATLARYRWNFMRLHYQSVMANEKRAIFDYFMMVCGPVALPDWAPIRAGLLNFLDKDGALRAIPPAVAAGGPKP